MEQGARDEWRLFVERLEEQIAQSAAVAGGEQPEKQFQI